MANVTFYEYRFADGTISITRGKLSKTALIYEVRKHGKVLSIKKSS